MTDDEFKKAGITTVTDETEANKTLENSDVLCTLQVVKERNSSDNSVGLHFKWDDSMEPPNKWDMDNLTPQQQFCLLLLTQIEALVGYIATSNKEHYVSERRDSLKPVTENNIDDILAELEAIDKDQIH
jgi:hypothetical protein